MSPPLQNAGIGSIARDTPNFAQISPFRELYRVLTPPQIGPFDATWLTLIMAQALWTVQGLLESLWMIPLLANLFALSSETKLPGYLCSRRMAEQTAKSQTVEKQVGKKQIRMMKKQTRMMSGEAQMVKNQTWMVKKQIVSSETTVSSLGRLTYAWSIWLIRCMCLASNWEVLDDSGFESRLQV